MPPNDVTAGAEAAVLYARHAARIHRFCVRRLGDRDEAADAVQDTFLKAWLALQNGAEVRHPLPWLLTIADNVCVSRFRARGARITTTELSECASVESTEATAGEMAGLAAALRTLPERQRQALLRRELQGYSYDEIGAELGVSRASVAALLHRARLAVADKLRDARRGAATLVPIPAFLRTPFESGVTGFAAAGTAAVAIALTPLAGPSPAASAPHPGPEGGTALTLDSSRYAIWTAPARPRANAELAVAEAGKAGAGARTQSTQAGVLVADDGLPGVASGPTGPASPGASETGPSQEGEPESTAVPAPQQPAPEFGDDEQPDESTPPSGGPHPTGGGANPPGRQPNGSNGRSASAPGRTHQPGSSASGEGSSGAQHGQNGGQGSVGGQGNGERPQPPQAGGGAAPGNADPPGKGAGEGGEAPPGNAGGGNENDPNQGKGGGGDDDGKGGGGGDDGKGGGQGKGGGGGKP
jgi:RNA polymerase sigma factor (sigma-70 family)